MYIWIFFYLGNSCSFIIICYLAVTAPCQKVKGHGRIVLAIRMQQQLHGVWCVLKQIHSTYILGTERIFKKSVLLKVKQQWGQWCVINWNLINAVLTLVLLQRIAMTSWILQLVRTSILIYVQKNQTLHGAPKKGVDFKFNPNEVSFLLSLLPSLDIALKSSGSRCSLSSFEIRDGITAHDGTAAYDAKCSFRRFVVGFNTVLVCSGNSSAVFAVVSKLLPSALSGL